MIDAKSMITKVLRGVLLTLLICLTANANAQTDRKFVRDGNRMFHHQKYDKAEVLYRKAVAKNASNPQALYNLGCALMMQGKDSAAVTQYQNAAKVEKNKMRLAQIYHNIGVICQNHQMYDDAIKAYAQSLRNNPKDDETRYNLALCKRLQKKQPQNKDKNKNQNKDKDKKNNNKDNKQDKKDQNKNDNNKDKSQQQKSEEQMSKDNAEQLLNAAMQNEKATQQRLRKAQQKQSSRRLQKNW